MLIYGINPVREAIRAGRVTTIRVAAANQGRVRELLALARERGVSVRHVDAAALDRAAAGGVHQGIVAEIVRRDEDYTIDDLVRGSAGPPLLVVLDGIEDPHNVGAILRTADAAGVHGVVRQARRAASLDGGGVGKASAGAVAFVKIATVVNIARAIDELKQAGVWTVGLDAGADTMYDAIDLTLPTALVFGAEGDGMRRLVRERCDRLATIPMHGHVQSLNVSVAAGVALFEAVRQRRSGPVIQK
jgi:23S rRNA (guanosine2251-2'-O)-methyltransferase